MLGLGAMVRLLHSNMCHGFEIWKQPLCTPRPCNIRSFMHWDVLFFRNAMNKKMHREEKESVNVLNGKEKTLCNSDNITVANDNEFE